MGQAGKAGRQASTRLWGQASTRLLFPEAAASGELAWATEESEESEEEHKASWGVGDSDLESAADSQSDSSTGRGGGGGGLLLGRRIEVLDETVGQPQWFRGTVISLDLSSVSSLPFALVHLSMPHTAMRCKVLVLAPSLSSHQNHAPCRSPRWSPPCAPRPSFSPSFLASARTVVLGPAR
jgi:hypothetical protein